MGRKRRIIVLLVSSVAAAAVVGAIAAAASSFGKRRAAVPIRHDVATAGRAMPEPVVSSVPAERASPVKTTDPCRRHLAPSAALKGDGGLVRENQMADCYGLPRIADTDQLERTIRSGDLMLIQPTEAYQLDHVGELDPANSRMYQHARPWVKVFLDDVFGMRHAETGEVFYVTSLVRTERYQKLIRGIRAFRRMAADGISLDRRSSHLTGATVDIRKSGFSRGTLHWLRRRLTELEAAGKVQATEERLCFHVMVYPTYSVR